MLEGRRECVAGDTIVKLFHTHREDFFFQFSMISTSEFMISIRLPIAVFAKLIS